MAGFFPVLYGRALSDALPSLADALHHLGARTVAEAPGARPFLGSGSTRLAIAYDGGLQGHTAEGRHGPEAALQVRGVAVLVRGRSTAAAALPLHTGALLEVLRSQVPGLLAALHAGGLRARLVDCAGPTKAQAYGAYLDGERLTYGLATEHRLVHVVPPALLPELERHATTESAARRRRRATHLTLDDGLGALAEAASLDEQLELGRVVAERHHLTLARLGSLLHALPRETRLAIVRGLGGLQSAARAQSAVPWRTAARATLLSPPPDLRDQIIGYDLLPLGHPGSLAVALEAPKSPRDSRVRRRFEAARDTLLGTRAPDAPTALAEAVSRIETMGVPALTRAALLAAHGGSPATLLAAAQHHYGLASLAEGLDAVLAQALSHASLHPDATRPDLAELVAQHLRTAHADATLVMLALVAQRQFQWQPQLSLADLSREGPSLLRAYRDVHREAIRPYLRQPAESPVRFPTRAR